MIDELLRLERELNEWARISQMASRDCLDRLDRERLAGEADGYTRAAVIIRFRIQELQKEMGGK